MELSGFLAELAAGRWTDDEVDEWTDMFFDGALLSADSPSLHDLMGMTFDECTSWIYDHKLPSQILAERIAMDSDKTPDRNRLEI